MTIRPGASTASIVALAAWLTLARTPGVAADGSAPMVQRGTQELSLSGSPDFLGPTGDTLTISAGYGWFVRDRMLVKGTLLYDTVEDIAPGENDYRAREADIVAEYHIDLGNAFLPYVGAELGWRRTKFGSEVESGFVLGPRAGLKCFIADNIAIDLALVYKLSGNDVFISDFEARDDYASFRFGLRAMF